MQKSVIITGATRGIGRACALKFAQMGWCVTGSYAKSQQAAQQLEQEIADMGGSCPVYSGGFARFRCGTAHG